LAVAYQQKKTWAQDAIWTEPPGPREVADAVLGLIGLGAIGRRTAELARALGMHVIAVREHPERGAETADEVFGPGALNEVLARSDYVVIAAPVTSATQHVINRERLGQVKSDAYLINVSRGVLIDEAALIETLRERRIAGAALDVFQHEPLPPESPLWTLDNVLITPHTAGLTSRMWERHYALFSENLRRYLAGQAMLGLVDKSRGY
jgi:phosphoglycerate dehydrogenase-like enzyme